MFNNIGKKIKALAQFICWIGILASVVFGIATTESLEYLGFVIMVAGSLVSWVSSFTLYGFGQLIDNTDKLVLSVEDLYEDEDDEDEDDEDEEDTYTEEDFLKDMQKEKSEKSKDFLTEIKETQTDDLKMILQDQKDLYSEEEINIIEKELIAREINMYNKNI